MNIIATDDEKAPLELLKNCIDTVVPGSTLHLFEDAEKALEFASANKVDVAFLDIHMREMSGIELAYRLKAANPVINIIFVTGFSDYLSEALRMHASGYINKPVSAEAVAKEIDNLLHPIDLTRTGRYAQTFGPFEFFVNGKPVRFKREKAKELLALLIDKEGASLTTEQIATYLYEDKPYDRSVKNLIMPIIRALTEGLADVDASDILLKTWGHLSVDITKFRCDAYDYRDGKAWALNLFRGEYMSNYSWAEDRNAEFYWDKMDSEDR